MPQAAVCTALRANVNTQRISLPRVLQVEKVVTNLGTTDIDTRLEEQMIDGILYAFQEQQSEVSAWLVCVCVCVCG